MGKGILDMTWWSARAALLWALLSLADASAATVTVRVGPADNDMSFFPASVSITVGDTVEWIWDTPFHSVTSFDKGFDSDVQNPPFTFTHTFNRAGSFPYFCVVHGMMTGTVEVSGTSTISLPADRDNTLYEDPAGQLSNGQGIYFFDGKTNTGVLRRGLIAFGLNSIPPNATITDATLSMFLSMGLGGSTAVSIHRVSQDWGEGASNAGDPGGAGIQAQAGDATWLHTFFDAGFWSAPGGDFSPTVSATTTVSALNTTYTWSGSGLIADVQAWVSDPATNFGWIIRGNEIDRGTTQRFNSGENSSNQPQLTVTYNVPGPTPSPTPAQAVNLSTRMRVMTGDNVGIGGLIISGNAPKHLLIRGIGPSLTQFGVPNALTDPVLELHGPGSFATVINDDWRDDPAQEAAILATGIAPSDNLESAIDTTLNPGPYTAVLRGKDNATGVALIEVYDLSQAVLAKLANISTRAFVSTGNDVVIAGFVLGNHSGADRIVVRGIGPSLTPLGVANALANPTLELRDNNGTLLIANNDWQDIPAQAAELSAAGLAPTNSLESGMATTLSPGQYTAILAGVSNGTGVGVVEVYDRGAP